MNQQSNPSEAVAIPDISTAINKLMQNPELLSMVASALGASPPSSDNASASPATQTEEPSQTTVKISDDAADSIPELLSHSPSDAVSSMLPLISRLSSLGASSRSSGNVKHEQLLCALKPYLSPSRCDAIDYILKISRMSVLLKGFKM